MTDCSVNRVIVVADQSYSGKLVEAAERGSGKLDNVVVMASGREGDYAWDSQVSDFTLAWSYGKHTKQCISQVQEVRSCIPLHPSIVQPRCSLFTFATYLLSG